MARGEVGTALVFDYGLRRIGIAAASAVGGTASAVATLTATSHGDPDWIGIDGLVREWQPEVLVVGLPYNEDGSESRMTGLARRFGQLLAARYGVTAEFVDERFTSVEAASLIRDARRAGVRRRRTRKGDVDRLAARLIAESWLRSQETARR